MDIVPTKKTYTIATKKTNTIATNVTSTASINFHSKYIRDCYILHVIVLLLIIIIICYYYLKRYNIKWKIMNFKKFVLKTVRVIILNQF